MPAVRGRDSAHFVMRAHLPGGNVTNGDRKTEEFCDKSVQCADLAIKYVSETAYVSFFEFPRRFTSSIHS